MSSMEFFALLPMTVLASMIILMMLFLCVMRHHLMFMLLTLASLWLTFIAMHHTSGMLEANAQPIFITSLLIIDANVIFFSKLIILSCMVVAVHAFQYFRHNSAAQKYVEEFYLLLLLCCLGAIVLVASQHFASFFLALEILGVSLFALIAYPVGTDLTATRSSRLSLEAAIKYLILSSVASAFFLLGVALIYQQTGALSLIQLQSYFMSITAFSDLFVPGAALLIFIGMGFKLSLVPFHWWTPDVYEGAPTPVTALIATVAKGAIIVAVMRFFVVTDAYRYPMLLNILTLVAVASMLVGNLLALRQQNIKRLLAYSSIAHLGYLLVAFLALINPLSVIKQQIAVEAIAVYICAYFVTSLGAFAVVGAVSDQSALAVDSYDLSRYRGLFWRRPWIASCFIFILLSLAGIPLTLGFIAKFYVFTAGAQSELWALLAAVVIGSAIGLYYYFHIIIVLVQKQAEQDVVLEKSNWLDAAIVFSLAGILIVFGVFPGYLIRWVPL